MKKFISCILVITVLFTFFTTVLANSGPVFWQGYPSSDIMTIEENSPIKVENENLVFDFSKYDNSSYGLNGKVTATYKMINPTNETQSVQMAFPFVGSINSLVRNNILITADNNVLSYDMYIGDVVNSYGNPNMDDKNTSFDFKNIVGNITDDVYTAKHFTENEKGKLYTIKVKPTTDVDINFVVDFNFDHNKTKVLTNGFNGLERNGNKTRITSWCHKQNTLEIYVLGEDIDLKINAYKDGELKKKTTSFTHKISTEEVEVRSYLMKYMKENTNIKNDGMISDNQLYNLYAKSLDESFTHYSGCSWGHDIIDMLNYDRILTLVYTVEFPPNSEKEVSVSYRTSGTMDKRETVKPLHSFDYLLNPAKNWSDFNNLNIKIIAPDEAPYIVKSNIDFEKEENNVYTAALENLPEDDLSFTLYANAKITLLDKARGSLKNNFGYGLILLIIVIIFIVFFLKRRKE